MFRFFTEREPEPLFGEGTSVFQRLTPCCLASQTGQIKHLEQLCNTDNSSNPTTHGLHLGNVTCCHLGSGPEQGNILRPGAILSGLVS